MAYLRAYQTPLEYVRPIYGTAFKTPQGSSVLYVGQPQSQPFKHFALDAMGQIGKIHSFLTPH
jgi:hypothetical protein